MATYQKYADMYKNRVGSRREPDSVSNFRLGDNDSTFEERSVSPILPHGRSGESRSSISPLRRDGYSKQSAQPRPDLTSTQDKTAYMTFLEI